MADPGNARVPIPGSALCETVDSFDGQQALGNGRRYTLTERLIANIPGPGTVPSLVMAPSGVRLVILGVSVDWAPVAAGINVAFEVTTAGSGLLAVPDTPLNTFAPATAELYIPGGSPEGTIPMLASSQLAVVTSEGDGSSPLYQLNIKTLFVPDEVVFTIHYAPIYAANPVC